MIKIIINNNNNNNSTDYNYYTHHIQVYTLKYKLVSSGALIKQLL